MGNVKSLISGNAIDFMADDVKEPHKELVSQYFVKYEKENPGTFIY